MSEETIQQLCNEIANFCIDEPAAALLIIIAIAAMIYFFAEVFFYTISKDK